MAARLAGPLWAVSKHATQDDMTKIDADGLLPRPAVLHEAVKPYQRADLLKACWQLVSTLGAYALLWLLMYLSLSISWWLIPPLVVVAAGLLVRIFIIFHDCCHGSFFRHPRANAICGFVCGALVFTPFHKWRREHMLHHATAGNLDRRGTGDLWTLTVEEYLSASRGTRLAYRLARNPFVLFALAPLYVFLVDHRFTAKASDKRERQSLWATNLAIALMAWATSAAFGLGPYLLMQLGVIGLAGSVGLWLFYVQHQFETVSWERHTNRRHVDAALQGSSFYKLPRVLQWFTGNIGYHHVHHLNPRVPNYHLERCHAAHPVFQEVATLTLLGGFRSLSLRLWDESTSELVGWRRLREKRRAT